MMLSISNRINFLAAIFLISIGAFVSDSLASEYEVEIGGQTYQVRVFSTHTEVTDQDQNIFIISSTSSGIAEVEKIQPGGGYSTTLYDTTHIHPTEQEQEHYDQLIEESEVIDDGGSQGPYPILSPNRERNGNVRIQSWACVGATLNLAAAAGGVVLGCSGPQGALACGVALSNYVAASVNYWESCTHN